MLLSGKGEENDRPLSSAGAAAALALAESLTAEPIAAVYSSPYPRAVETALPIAAAHGVEVQIVDDLRERLLSPHPLDDWYAQVRGTTSTTRSLTANQAVRPRIGGTAPSRSWPRVIRARPSSPRATAT